MDLTFYNQIKEILSSARAKVYSAANFAMVEAYWEIGKRIVEKQGGNATAEYGSKLIEELSKQMTADFGKGFTVANLKNMRQFYLVFQNRYTLCSQLSWSHYRLLMRVDDDKAMQERTLTRASSKSKSYIKAIKFLIKKIVTRCVAILYYYLISLPISSSMVMP